MDTAYVYWGYYCYGTIIMYQFEIKFNSYRYDPGSAHSMGDQRWFEKRNLEYYFAPTYEGCLELEAMLYQELHKETIWKKRLLPR